VNARWPTLVLAAGVAACGDRAAPGDAPPAASLDALAREYVELALAFDEHDADYVDAYFGPAQLQPTEAPSLPELRARAEGARAAVAALRVDSSSALERGRRLLLDKRLAAMLLRIDMVDPASGRRPPFDEESRILFDAVAPDLDAAHFARVIDEIAAMLPGDGPLAERVEAFRRQFVVPADRLAAVIDAAIAECRRRTLQHIALPDGESFAVEYVTGQSWSAYNWYKGDYFSVIQINTDLPIFVDRAVDLGCHEGYPGHHVQNVLRERDLLRARGWIEYTLVPLYGPQAPLDEGGANYGINLAFPGAERLAFERDVLYPLAGLDAGGAERYARLNELLLELSYARNEAARDYLDGTVTREQAVSWLVDYQLMSQERAEQGVRFIESYRSYVINYNVGKDLIRAGVEAAGADAATRWAEYARLVATPVAPSELAER
jgi:hypothetical protein